MKASEKVPKTVGRSPSPRPRATSVRQTPETAPRRGKTSASTRGAARAKPAAKPTAVPAPVRERMETQGPSVRAAPVPDLRALWVVFCALLTVDLVLLAVVVFR